MNKRLLPLLFGATFPFCKAGAQITLEHEYKGHSYPYVARLEGETDKWLLVDTGGTQVDFFNSDHSVWKTIPLAPAAGFKATYAVLASKYFFDGDGEVEVFAVYVNFVTGKYESRIVNESGSTQQAFPDESSPSTAKINGTWKIITFRSENGKTFNRIYSVPGTYSGLKVAGKADGDATEATLFPNPVGAAATLRYTLPTGTTTGTMTITNMSGQVLRSYQLSSAFSDILVQTGDLAPGVYVYQVEAGGVKGEAERFEVR